MDLNKSLEFFDPNKVKARCHIIGCGSIGGNVAELLARYGVKDLVLYDFDNVDNYWRVMCLCVLILLRYDRKS